MTLASTVFKLEDLKVLRCSPDLLNNVKIGQGQLQLIMEQILFYHILGQKRNGAYKDKKYCVLNESYKISSAIYVSLLFLSHIIPIVSLSSVTQTSVMAVFLFSSLSRAHSFSLT